MEGSKRSSKRLLASDGPKKSFKPIHHNERLSHIASVMQPARDSISKITDSQVLLNQVKIKTPNLQYSKSVHESSAVNQNEKVLKK